MGVEYALELELPQKSTEASRELAAFCQSAYPKLASMLSLYCGDRDLAQDLAQETIVRLVQNWKKVSQLSDRTAWCRRVAINSANSWFRRLAAKRNATRRLEARTRSHHHDPDSATTMAIRSAIAGLPPRQREVVILRFYEDLPVIEVAQVMRCQEGTVWALTNQAIASLRSAGLAEFKEIAHAD